MSAHWDCLSETCGAGAAGSGAESEVGVATQQGPPQAQRVQQGGALATAASTGRKPGVSATNTLNKIEKTVFTLLIWKDAVLSVPLILSIALSRPSLAGFGLCLVDFLKVFGRVFFEIFEAGFAAELNFSAVLLEGVRLAHLAQFLAGNNAGRKRVWLRVLIFGKSS
jgi:hypothetical protein